MAQIDFSKIFQNPDGSFKQPEIIAESLLLIKDINQSYNIKLEMIGWLKEKGHETSFLPEIKAIYDHARDVSGIGVGREIREEDFLILMERCDVENLSQKFRKPNFRNYKKSLLKLMNYMDLDAENRIGKQVYNDLEKNGLYPEVLDGIKKYINNCGFYFKGQIYCEAVKKAEASENLFNLSFREGEYSYKEKEFIKSLGVKQIEFKADGKYTGLADIFKGKPGVNFNPENAGFCVSASRLDEARKIKHLILQDLTGEEAYRLSDFTVVCPDDETFRILNNYLHAEEVPVYSSYKYSGNDINTDVLRLFNAGVEGDAQSILNFFNLYLAEKPLLFDDLTDFDVNALIAKLFETKNSDYKLKASADLKKFIEKFLKAVRVSDGEMSAEKALSLIKSKLKNLNEAFEMLGKKLETDIYTYEETVKKIFGDKERKLTDYLDYLYLIATKTNTERLNKDQNGVCLIMMNEPVPSGKHLILAGITEDVFLKSSNPLKIISKENYFDLYKSVYGINPEEALYDNLRMITSGKTEKLTFFVPQWGEEYIPSTKLDRITGLCEKKKYKIEVIPHDKIKKDLESGFGITLSDKLKEKDFGMLCTTKPEKKPEMHEFAICLKEGNIEDKLVSASKIESFMACPAAHVHDLNLEYDSVEPQFPFIKGNFYHGVTEKFLKYYKGSDLLNETDYALLVAGLSGDKAKDDIAKTRFSEFPEFFLYGVKSGKYNLPFETLSERINRSGILSFIDEEILKQEMNDPYSYYARQKQKSEIIGFLAWLILELGPTPVSVTSTFETEVKFSDLEVMKEPQINIKRGYIDFLFIDHSGTVRIIDIKSNKKFDKFEDEISGYQKVQILLYREAVSRHIKGEAGVVLMPVKEEDKPQDKDCTILEKDYFRSVSKDAEVEAVYYSPNSPYRLPVNKQLFEEFIFRLKERLNTGGFYKPLSCSKCEYCALSQSCPAFEDKKFEKFDRFTPNLHAEVQSLLLEELKNEKDIKDREDTKKFIMFEGDKAEALSSDDHIIISAGAGAGKTEVLSSRYISLLLNTEANLDNIICITFTKKAAGEMQKRIYSKLNDILESGYFFPVYKGSDPASYRLNEKQRGKLSVIKDEFYDKNLISTFHSFCNKFITEYGYFSDNLKGYDIAMDLSVDYKAGEEAVKFLKRNFDTEFKGILQKSLNGDEYEEFEKWLGSRHLIYSGDNEGGFIPDILKLYDEIKLSGKGFEADVWVNSLDGYLKAVEERIKNEFGEYFRLREEILGMIRGETDDKLLALGEKIRNYKEFSYKQAAKKFPDILAAAEELFESEGYKIFNRKNVDLSLNGSEWIIKKAVFEIIRALDGHINGFKRDKGLLEQSDLHIHFLEMLKDEDLREKLQSEFRYILVDEFQDTNWLQDKILDSLAGKENKFFFVGDKKQSIYSFQQCDVQIFEKYEQSKEFKKLYFSENYRSVPHIVNFNNSVFEMTALNRYNIIGSKDELLVPDKKDNIYPASVNFVNICTKKAKDNNKDVIANELGRISKMCEAAFVADTITKNAVSGKKFGSWAVLIRKYTHIGYITEAFRKKNIPYTLILKKDLFELDEVKEFVLILKAVLGAAAHEEIEFMPEYRELLASVRKDEPLMSLIFNLAKNKTYTKYLASFDDYRTKAANIEILKETLISFLSNSDNDRERFLTELEKNIKSNSAGVEVRDSGAVTIMTVHSAKGLEFDDLIVANLDENSGNFTTLFNYINLCSNGSCYTDFSMSGYSTPGGKEKKNFFLNEYIKHKNNDFDDQERANLLYVALTRAKNSLTVIIQTKDESGSIDSEKREGWAKYLRQFGTENEGKLKGFRFIQKDISEFDLSAYYEKAGAGCETYDAEIEYDLTGQIETDRMTSPTGLSHKDDEAVHEKANIAAIDTGNFLHLFMCKKINDIFRHGFDLKAELEKFRKTEVENQDARVPAVRKMLENIITDETFKEYVQNSRILCEKSIFDTNVQGYIDLVLIGEKEVAVIDYKTYLNKYPDEELIGKYKNQVRIYADALSKIYPNKTVKKYLFFTGKDNAELKEIL